MDMETNINPVTIYGEVVRGNNADPHAYRKSWHRFLDEHDVSDTTVYALYYNYESDYRGDFDFVIGTAADNGKTAHVINGGKYYIWDIGTDDPMDVADAWWEIWRRDDIMRAYGTDFEVYVPGESIKICLSIK